MTYSKTLSIKAAAALGEAVRGYGVVFHAQEDPDTDMFCGAASAQVALNQLVLG